MTIYNYLIPIFASVILISCGTKELRPDQYIEVGRGEKALLMTTNQDSLDIFGWFIEDMLESIFGGSYKNATVSQVDEKPISNPFLYDNQHVLIEPGERIILINCTVTNKDKDGKIESYDHYSNSIQMKFVGGFKYKVTIDSNIGDDCKPIIEPDDKYNKSLNKDAPPEGGAPVS